MFGKKEVKVLIFIANFLFSEATVYNFTKTREGVYTAKVRFRLSNFGEISATALNEAIQESLKDFDRVLEIEKELERKDLNVKKGTTAARHQAFFGTKLISSEIRNTGEIATGALTHLHESLLRQHTIVRLNMDNTFMADYCPNKIICDQSKYRTIDGSCNNERRPDWGKSFTTFQRMLEPQYADGLTQPRIASDGGPLPGAREVSTSSIPDVDIPNQFYTLVLMQWGQFVDHDLTLTTLTKTSNGKEIKCCDPEIQKNPRLQHPACFPINIPKDDSFFSKYEQTCMEFVRSLPATDADCTISHREQLNQLTSFLDGSNIYGSTVEEINELREFKNGKLKTSRIHDKVMLPMQTESTQECEDSEANLQCFKAGDERVNEGVNLAVMHTIWVREHNKISEELLKLNPHWNDETVFQETRRIVGAEIQHITYNEDLPLLLGKTIMNQYELNTLSDGFSFAYNSEVNPSIINAFSSAAYRFGHTLVQGHIHLMEENGELFKKLPLSDQYFNPLSLYTEKQLDRYLRGLVNQPSQTYDKFVTEQLTNHLYQTHHNEYGFDLIALNIQRGRDHGIPGYNAWRERCGLRKFRNFKELESVMGSFTARAFEKLYRNVDDIDLFPAGISERSVQDGVLGPTFACIVAEQFKRLKIGDRFWYENGRTPFSFTSAQLQQIRKITLARIICDNSNDIKSIQRQAFQIVQPWNPKVQCSSTDIPKINFETWRE